MGFDKYFKFLKGCKEKKYDGMRTQKHHIVPKKLGGSDEKENLIELSYEDHEKAHFILADCFEEGTYERNMNLWSARFVRKQSNLSDEDWKKISESMQGENNPFYGKTHDEKTKQVLAKKAKEQRKGKSYEEIYGEEKARKEKEKRAKKTRTDEEYERDAVRGENHDGTNLTKREAREVKWLAKHGNMKQKKVAEIYNISQASVTDIKKERRWEHIEPKQTRIN
jgi:hypothetical protein